MAGLRRIARENPEAKILLWQTLSSARPSLPAIGPERLSPAFVEWMVGLPSGFVTGVPLTRASALRCLGNIVVPQFAAVIVRELLVELSAFLTAGDGEPGPSAVPRQRAPLSRQAKVSSA